MAPTPTGLNVNDVVQTTISLTATPAGYRNFGACLCLGPTAVIDTNERRRIYTGLTGVAADFPIGSPELAFATLFFSQSPQPDYLQIGRWAQAATSGILHGAGLTPAQRLLTSFTAITNGAMLVSVDGVPYALTGLNFSACVNLNGVAYVIQQALNAAGAAGSGAAGAKVVWGAENVRFDIVSGSTGPGSSVGYAASPTALDALTFTTNPAANSTVTLNGTVVTFVAANPAAGQVLIGTNLAATLASLLTFLNASVDAQISKFSFVLAGSVLYTLAKATGTAGNGLTLAASGTSGATVATAATANGGGTDVSILLGLSITPTSSGANANPPIAGIAAESLLSAVELFDATWGDWYALAAAAPNIADADHISVSEYIEGTTRSRIYGIYSANTELWDSTRSDDLASVLVAAGVSRTMIAFSTTTPYSIASLFGRFATVNYSGSKTTITLKFKQMPGVAAEALTENQASTLDGKRANYFAAYQNGASIIQQGVMLNGNFIDSRINADWLANYAQTNLFNLYTSMPKVPQTDAGTALQVANLTASLGQAVTNGYLAAGVWNGPEFGNVTYGKFLPLGFEIFAPLVATQSETDRAARKSVPFQIAGKEAGAVHSASVSILINP